MERFRADPANKGKLIDVGLWRYTRHPNYFGDACVWWGIFLVAADALPGVATIFAPIVMTLLLTVGSGARILEKQHEQARRLGRVRRPNQHVLPAAAASKWAVTSS